MRQPFEHMPEHPRALQQACAPAMLGDAPRNAQTDRQTYKHLTHLSKHLTLSNARRGAGRSRPTGGHTPLTASATRGQTPAVPHA